MRVKLNKNKIKTSIATFILILFSEQTISMFAPSKHFSSFHSKLYVEFFKVCAILEHLQDNQFKRTLETSKRRQREGRLPFFDEKSLV